MSRFFSGKYAGLEAYVPGEQPRDRKYIKLNTNESPFPPSDGVRAAVSEEAGKLMLYPDPECTELSTAAAGVLGVSPDMLLMTNGSDEILDFAFAAFGDETHPFAFPDITYGFYPVFAKRHGVPFKTVPLKPDFSVDPGDYEGIGMNVVIANPNAPTGLTLTVEQVERIAATNPDNVVIIDEAYVDFGAQTALPLIKRYGNLIVTRTFSKSCSLAGARLGFGAACPELIRDLSTVKYSTNPYNVNRMTAAAGTAALREAEYYAENCRSIMKIREKTGRELERLGFTVTDSSANFLFAAHGSVGGKELYAKLKEKGILIRHFDLPKIKDYNRITVGTAEQMESFIRAAETVIKESV